MAGTSTKRLPLYLNGAGKIGDWDYGVLRATYAGQPNSSLAFAAAKLLADPDDKTWVPKAARYDVVIPPGTPDLYLDPKELWSRYEAARLPQQKDLAIALTLYVPGLAALHDGYETVRAWALHALARKRRLAVMVAMHAPHLVGSRNDPHVHVLATARELGLGGFGVFCGLCSDQALLALHAEWDNHQRAWTTSTRA